MSHWPFILAAYGLALGGTAILLAASFIAMRRVEAKADELRQEQ
jgi:hypothetical protein